MHKWKVCYADVEVSLTVDSSGAIELLKQLMPDLRLQPCNNPCEINLCVGNYDQIWFIEDETLSERLIFHEVGDFLYNLTDRIVHHLASHSRSAHCLHAAAVKIDTLTVIMPGGSGAGKSMLTSWLVAEGCQYITDELVFIKNVVCADGFSRPIQIKPKGLPILKTLLPDGAVFFQGDSANSVPISSLGGSISDGCGEGCVIIFPEFANTNSFVFESISKADAGARLMSHYVNARNFEGHGFKAIVALVREIPCFKLEYGGFSHIPKDFVHTFRQIGLKQLSS